MKTNTSRQKMTKRTLRIAISIALLLMLFFLIGIMTVKAKPIIKKMREREYIKFISSLTKVSNVGGPKAAEAIIAALPHLHPDAQESFCRSLGKIGDNRAIDPLIKLLQSRGTSKANTNWESMSKVRLREACAEALGNFRDPRARTALQDAVIYDPDWQVYHAAKQALYRMGNDTSYSDYDVLIAKVTLAVTKWPEPVNGVEEYIRQWHENHPNWQGSWGGPMLNDFASLTDIERERNSVVKTAIDWKNDYRAGGVVELLMEYLCSRKLNIGPENAKNLLIRIGKPALPALEIGMKRGDIVLSRNCQECIYAINTPGKNRVEVMERAP
jgi:hypothetical protein